MYLVRCGSRLINLEYLICAEEIGQATDGVSRTVKVTLVPGKHFELSGPDADLLREEIGKAMILLGFDRSGKRASRAERDPKARRPRKRDPNMTG